jgi:hypothetical protein
MSGYLVGHYVFMGDDQKTLHDSRSGNYRINDLSPCSVHMQKHCGARMEFRLTGDKLGG